MVARRQIKEAPRESGGLYFTGKNKVACIPSGCTLLDCVLAGSARGGWARGRISNIVGDKAVGKTLLAIEACANFSIQEPEGLIFYREAEAAFDIEYAAALGLPVARVDFGKDGPGAGWDTIEDIFEDLEAVIGRLEKLQEKYTKEKSNKKVSALYIIDSLDALTSRAELGRKVDEGSYGLEKQKLMGRLFRQLVRRMKNVDLTLIFISQIRDKIGVTFGEKHTRSGGKALDFYASQILWLSHLANLTRTIGGVKRTTAQKIKAKCKKNKVSMPFRDCEFVTRFGYGIEDVEASVAWLREVDALESIGFVPKEKKGKKEAPSAKELDEFVDDFLDEVADASGAQLASLTAKVRGAVNDAWQEIESRFAPKRAKYPA